MLASVGGARLDFLPGYRVAGWRRRRGQDHAFLSENAGHFVEDLVEWLVPSISAKEAASSSIREMLSGVVLFGGLSKALSFLPSLGLFRFRKSGLSSALDGFKEWARIFSFLVSCAG